MYIYFFHSIYSINQHLFYIFNICFNFYFTVEIGTIKTTELNRVGHVTRSKDSISIFLFPQLKCDCLARSTSPTAAFRISLEDCCHLSTSTFLFFLFVYMITRVCLHITHLSSLVDKYYRTYSSQIVCERTVSLIGLLSIEDLYLGLLSSSTHLDCVVL